MADGVFTLDLTESFERLPRAPIVQALIHWQARGQKPLEENSLRAALAEKLPNYPQKAPIQQFGPMVSMAPASESPPVQHPRTIFMGWRLMSPDGHYVVQFSRDGLLFSRTRPYEHWELFVEAAKQAWRVFVELADPAEIQRLGVRFINQIAAATPENLHDFLREPPTCPSNLPLEDFVYQSRFAVPGEPFGIRIIKVMQPSMPAIPSSSGLFLDIEVFSTTAIQNDSAALDEALTKMRWLKNKVFFTLLTDGAMNAFKKGAS
jgi:uncharacterized protein (TIGR04255 family)